MTREVHLELPLSGGATVVLQLCNKYGINILGKHKELVLDGNSEVHAILEVNTGNTCWKVEQLVDNNLFWVYEGEGLQGVNMQEMVYSQGLLDVFLSSNDNTLGENAESVLTRHYRKEVLVCEEEKRFICRFYGWVKEQQDLDMCRLNKMLMKRYNNA